MSKSSKHGHHSSRSFWKSALSCLFAFFLSLAFTAIGLILLTRTVTSEKFTAGSFDEQYASYVQTYLNDAVSDYTQPTFIDVNVLDGLFTKELVYKDTVQAVSAIYRSESYVPDTTALTDQLTVNTSAFFEGEGLADDPEVPEIISSYVSEIMEFYENAFQMRGLAQIVRVNGLLNRFFWIGIAGACVLAAILIFLCIRLHRWAHRGMRYVAYAAGGAFLMTLAAPLVLYISRLYERLQITPQYFYYFVTNYTRRVLEGFLITAAAWLVITVILAVVIKLMRNHAVYSED